MSQHEFIPTLNPGENYWDAIPKRDAAVHASQEDDFSTLLPHVPVGEVPPDLVFTEGNQVAPPAQARRYARLAETFSPLIESAVGPGAAAHFESEVRAISHNAIVVLDAVERLDALTDGDVEAAHIDADEVLLEFVPDEVKAAYLAARERVGFWFA